MTPTRWMLNSLFFFCFSIVKIIDNKDILKKYKNKNKYSIRIWIIFKIEVNKSILLLKNINLYNFIYILKKNNNNKGME